MAKKKRKIDDPIQSSFLENYGHTAPAVPAIRQEVQQWRESNYKGATATTKTLLNYWFHTDHRLPNGRKFAYYSAQQEALEAIIYSFEIAQVRSMKDLFQRFIPADLAANVRLPSYDPFARFATKMATGSGKTKVMSLAIAWQYFNAVIESKPDYAKTFVIIAPNIIVYERLSTDFVGGQIFKEDPIVPKQFRIFWDMQFYVRGESERSSSEGAVYVTNIQQLYDDRERSNNEPDVMTMVLGSKPPTSLNEEDSFRERIAKRSGAPVMIVNDEAHHTHEEDSSWNQSIRSVNEEHPQGVNIQLDFSATPRHSTGALFAWVISDYTLKQAIIDGLVKRPMKGVSDMGEVQSDIPSVRYEPFVIAGVERWREYRDELKKLGKKPVLFVMMNDTNEADAIGDYLRTKFPDDFGGKKTLVIHVYAQNSKHGLRGDIRQDELEIARQAAREVDSNESPINAIVSVLMLREGWDVQNVTVIVGLRPYSSKAEILPEQTIGRGLRLMFRGLNSPYQERVDIIGNSGFIRFVEQLEQEEGLRFDQWKVGKDKLVITTIEPDPDKAEYDIALPVLSPIMTRAKSLAEEIDAIDIHTMHCPYPALPRKRDSQEEITFRYEGKDILTLETLVEREYRIPTPQTSGEIISYFAQVIAHEIKLPSHFSNLAPKIRDFFKYRAFGQEVDLDTEEIIQAMSRSIALLVVKDVFMTELRDKLVQELQPVLENEGRLLSGIEPFPWSRNTVHCRKTIFNQVPCDNDFEADFSKFLDNASDVLKFGKLPLNFGFAIPYTDNVGNLRYYYPDFVVVDEDDRNYIVETKGREDTNVANKDRAAAMWCESATQLTGKSWQYLKVLQQKFEQLQPPDFGDCVFYLAQHERTLFDDLEG